MIRINQSDCKTPLYIRDQDKPPLLLICLPMKLMHYAYVENHWSADAKETVLNELLGWQSIQSLGKKKRLIRLISRDHVQSCYIHFILPSHFTLIKVRGMKTVLSAVYLMAHKNMRKVELFIAKFLKLQYSGVFRCTH